MCFPTEKTFYLLVWLQTWTSVLYSIISFRNVEYLRIAIFSNYICTCMCTLWYMYMYRISIGYILTHGKSCTCIKYSTIKNLDTWPRVILPCVYSLIRFRCFNFRTRGEYPEM